ncbi:hypothetical protein AB4Y42_43590 [Paraburkholderia sp. EG286B]|uniref:hypothetical protein n=1 Tax=Paraburkholderia sp. EG286B TaxID=3237011 RepID=UPI0034D31D06
MMFFTVRPNKSVWQLCLAFALFYVMGIHPAIAQTTCEAGLQLFRGVCMRQNMVELLNCIESTGGNREQAESIVRQHANQSASGALSGSGAGVIVRGAGSMTLQGVNEGEAVEEFRQRFYAGGGQLCFDAVKFESSADGASPPSLQPEISGSAPYRTLYFKNSGGDILNPKIDTVARVFVTLNGGSGGRQINMATTGSASYGANPNDSKTPFHILFDESHQQLDAIATSVAAKQGVSRNAVTADEDIAIKITFQDSKGSNFERYFEIDSNDSILCDMRCLKRSNGDRYQEIAQDLAQARQKQTPTSMMPDYIIWHLNH